ncbi:MAG: hypothetical protein ACI4HI_15940 [Lachnospiraceae bacterium]
MRGKNTGKKIAAIAMSVVLLSPTHLFAQSMQLQSSFAQMQAVQTADYMENGTQATCEVTVTDPTSEKEQETCVSLEGQASDNRSNQNYTRWSSVQNSYLHQNTDGTLTRVEHTTAGVLIETYSEDGKTRLSTKTIKKELNLFGGCFCGTENNYLVFGQENEKESDETEVIRVVKYTKNWERVDDCKIYGANTYLPFDAGSLRMIELEGNLYIYTCHEMYADKEEPGTHHQANMLFTVDEKTMETKDSMYEVSNLVDGYVSHSFNQFIRTDGTSIYRVDHSEANTLSMYDEYLSVNGITLTKYHKDSSSTNVRVHIPLKFDIHEGNYTGASIGGLELGENNCLIAYNKDVSNFCENRNVYVAITDQLLNQTKIIQLTAYTQNDSITCYTPQLVKINENMFLVMWEEYDEKTQEIITKLMTIDADGNTISKAVETDLKESDCQPIVCQDGTVKWYVTEKEGSMLYTVNPYHLERIQKQTQPITESCVKKISDFVYTGKQICPKPEVTVASKRLKQGADYTVQYGTNKIGKGTVTIIGKGNYSGIVKTTFTIVPRKTTVSLKSSAKGKIQVTVSKKKEANQYQIQYAQNAKFKGAKNLTIKSVKTTLSTTSGKTYYVRARAIKKDGTKTYTGGWSTAKKIKVK